MRGGPQDDVCQQAGLGDGEDGDGTSPRVAGASSCAPRLQRRLVQLQRKRSDEVYGGGIG